MPVAHLQKDVKSCPHSLRIEILDLGIAHRKMPTQRASLIQADMFIGLVQTCVLGCAYTRKTHEECPVPLHFLRLAHSPLIFSRTLSTLIKTHDTNFPPRHRRQKTPR